MKVCGDLKQFSCEFEKLNARVIERINIYLFWGVWCVIHHNAPHLLGAIKALSRREGRQLGRPSSFEYSVTER